MKKLFILFLMAVCSMTGLAQTIIDPLLSEEMGRRNDDEQITVIVIMKSQYDRTQLNRRADYFVTRAERREFVVNELKEFAAASQYDLKRSLSEMERNGLVSSPTVLWMANAMYFDATKMAIQDLARRNDIEIIGYAMEHNWIPDGEEASPALATREITQNVIRVGANQVWDLGYTGEGVVVAVIDTGVNYNHVDLADHLWDGGEEFPHHGYDVKNHDNDPMDDHGHGSHCSGTVCGDGTAGSQTGMAPNATLMCVKCLASDGNGGAQSISEGIQWAVDHGCDMFSMSLGLPNSSISERTLLRHTCDAALDAGVVAAIAAGNEGDMLWGYPIPNNVRVPGSCPPPYMDAVQGENPGELSCSICIGAVDYNDIAASFTSHGPVTWSNTVFGDYPYNPGIGLIRPDVSAPGVNIKSLNYATNNGYTNMSGTSMATPCAAGCIALMLSKDINLTPSDVCRILEETAVPLGTGKSNIYGFGRVNVLAAIEAIQVGAIKYNDFSINDIEGNNDHRLNPGESVMMSLALENITDEEVDNVHVVLSTNNGEVTIMHDAVDFPSFAPNGIMTVENAFAFSVTENVTSGQNIRFNIAVVVDGEVAGNFSFNVEVYDYLIQYANTVVLNDDDNNGLLSSGETADLRIILDNVGNEMAQMLKGSLSTDYEFITINEGEQSFNTIGTGMMGYADFNVTLDSVAPEGFTIPFTLYLEDSEGRHNELAFNFKNSCRLIFSLHDSNGDGWQGCYFRLSYSDGTPTEQITLEEGSEATFAREVTLGSEIMLRWFNGQGASQCSFELAYEDGTLIFENNGGFSGNKFFSINCANGSSAPELCKPVQNLSHVLDGHDVVLSWDAPRDLMPTGYEVYRETVLLTFTDEMTYTDPNLEDGFYNYCVYAVYEDCQSEYACELVEVYSCQGVRDLNYSLNDEQQLILTWEAPENPVGLIEYQIYMDDEYLGSTIELTYAFTVMEGEHDIMVKAVFDGCERDGHIRVCVVGAVENLEYINTEGHHVVVVWNAVEGIGEYEVFVNGEWATNVEETTYIADFGAGLTIVMVRPVADDCYALGNSIEVCLIDPIENLMFGGLDEEGRLTCLWDTVEYAAYYEVSLNGMVIAEQIADPNVSFVPIVGSNEICVTAISVFGCGTYPPVCATQNLCSAVDGFDYALNGSEVKVTWNGDADSYYVRLDGGETTIVETNAYTAALEGSHTIEVTPIYEDCMALTAQFDFQICAPVDGFDYAFNGDEVKVTWNGDATSYLVKLDDGDDVTVETNAYTATLVGSHTIEVTPLYGDCLASAAQFDFQTSNVTPEIHITEVRVGLMSTAWNVVEGAIAYNLYRNNQLVAGNLTGTVYNDTEMPIDAQHCYAVASVFEKGVSDLSESACANYFTGLDENDGIVSIFPNPTSDKVTIQCDGMTLVEVFSIEGKLLQGIEAENDVCQIDHLETGIYMIRIHKGEDIFIRRIVKK